MRFLSPTCLVALTLLSSLTFATQNANAASRYFTIDEGRIHLHGTYDSLRRIEIRSKGSHLKLETEAIPQRYTEPFPADKGFAVVEKPEHVILGVLGPGNRIAIEGQTATSILYADSVETAIGGDLTVNVGTGDVGGASTLDIGKLTDLSQGATVVDGVVTMVGSFADLAGIEAKSAGGHLSLATNPEGSDVRPLIAPFKPNQSLILSLAESEIDVRVMHPGFAFDIDGDTPTAFLYAESGEVARRDVTLRVGLGDAATVRVPYAVPEPAAAGMLMAGIGLVIGCRNRRKISVTG